MAFKFENLDSKIRELMLDEVEMDMKNKNLYISSRLSEFGLIHYSRLLKNAIQSGNEVSFANNLKIQNCFKQTTPVTANETLAEGEFNRYYIRALCRSILNEKPFTLEIYRAKRVSNPRYESQMSIGKTLDSEKLLNDLRNKIHVLGGPNSGLSVRIKN